MEKEIKKGAENIRTYQVTGLDDQGQFITYETDTLPLLGGYKSEKIYGDPSYCPTATHQHLKTHEKTGEMPNLVYFDSVEAAVAAEFRPCGSCWVKDDSEISIQHWQEYIDACDKLGVERAKAPKVIGETEKPPAKPKVSELLAADLGLDADTVNHMAAWETKHSLHTNDVVPTLEMIAGTLRTIEDFQQWQKDVTLFVRESAGLWPKMSERARAKVDAMIEDLALQAKDSDRLHAAEIYIIWRNRVWKEPASGSVKTGEQILLGKDLQPLTYLRDLMEFITPEEFTDMGTLLKEGLSRSGKLRLDKIVEYDNVKTDFSACPDLVTEKIADCFVETGYVARGKDGKYRLTAVGKQARRFGYDELRSAVLANDYFEVTFGGKQQKLRTLKDIGIIQRKYRTLNERTEIEFTLNKPSIEVYYLPKILLGSKDLDEKRLIGTIEELESRSPEELPDVIVVSALIQGAFQYVDKNKRTSLSLKSLDDQFKAARIVMDRLEALGVPIIYNLSPEDRAVCYNGTIEAINLLEHTARPLKDTDKPYVSYIGLDQMKMKHAKAWDVHSEFQLNVVFPYCLRTGRRLRSADEIDALSRGRIRIEEYLMLIDTYKALIEGRQPNPEYADFLKIENIPYPGYEPQGFRFVDDVRIIANIREEI